MITIAMLSLLLLAAIGGFIIINYIPYMVLVLLAASVILVTVAISKWFIK